MECMQCISTNFDTPSLDQFLQLTQSFCFQNFLMNDECYNEKFSIISGMVTQAWVTHPFTAFNQHHLLELQAKQWQTFQQANRTPCIKQLTSTSMQLVAYVLIN